MILTGMHKKSLEAAAHLESVEKFDDEKDEEVDPGNNGKLFAAKRFEEGSEDETGSFQHIRQQGMRE